MRIVTTLEMKEIERLAVEEFHLDETLIIENAGAQAAHWFMQNCFKNDQEGGIIFLLGKGKNGADGLAMARNLVNLKTKYTIMAFCLYPEHECSKEFMKQLKRAQAYGLRVSLLRSVEDLSAYFFQSQKNTIVVDAMFGSGIRLPLPNNVYDVIRFVNQHAENIISIDIPSGVEGDSGKTAGSAVRATHTIAIGAPKLGCFIANGVSHTGQLHLVNAGFPQQLFNLGDKFQVDTNTFQEILSYRSKYAHKNFNGHTLVIGGSLGLTGALVLATQASKRVGSGLVTALTWEENHLEYLTRQIPEIMSAVIPADEKTWNSFSQWFEHFDSIVIGPGLGRDQRATSILKKVLTSFQGPVVVDADAIHLLNLKEDASILANRKFPTVLTPHFGEFAQLLSLSKEQAFIESLTHLKDAVHQTASVIILKGPCTSIAFPSGKIYFNFFPNEGMATGGTGDVLAGILGGMLAQEFARIRQHDYGYSKPIDIEKIILMAIALHTHAGFFAKQQLGSRAMSASSLIENFPQAFEVLEKMV